MTRFCPSKRSRRACGKTQDEACGGATLRPMTPQEKRELQAQVARLKAKARRARARRRESDKRFEQAVATLRELSGRG
jgi:hypothetical protein